MPNSNTLAILCGGRSARLGTDKGLYRPLGDESILCRAIRLVGEGFAEILIIVKDWEQQALYEAELSRNFSEAARSRMRVVPDEARNHAASTGILTAVCRSRTDWTLCLAVDQVAIRPRHLNLLAHAVRLTTDRVQALATFDDIKQDFVPFPSAWKKTSVDQLHTSMNAGLLSIKGLLHELGAQRLNAPQYLRDYDVNCNSEKDFSEHFGAPLVDPFNRRLHYLRFSLTEACNLSCAYCLPHGFPEWYRHKAKLGFTEVGTILKGFRQLGFRKVRFTGGEPTVHPDCLKAVALAHELGYEKIALSTNGLLLNDLAAWRDAGLSQMNVSLDSLRPDEFKKMASSTDTAKVVRTIESAAELGIDTKVNTVLMRSINGGSIEELIDWALQRPISLRFIELMPTKLNQSFSSRERVLGSEIEPLLLERGLRLAATEKGASPNLRGPATVYESTRHPGRIGLINPLSANFCGTCNRLRVTSRGRLKLCLFGDDDLPLDLSTPETVALSVRGVIGQKPERHHLEEDKVGNVSTFRTIGG